MKETIRKFIKSLDIDDVGFASVDDYNSPILPKIENFFPEAKSIIVLAYRELSSIESPNMQLAMNGRLDKNEIMHYDSYRISRFLENEFNAKIVSIPWSPTSDLNDKTRKGIVSDLSLRHAAVAAGLGSFGRHNLVVHPSMGSRVTFCAIVTNLELESDPKIAQDLCIHCNNCVKDCPAQALNEEGKTDVLKCLGVSQPFWHNAFLTYLDKYINPAQKEKLQMQMQNSFWCFSQAMSNGIQYYCFNCLRNCPVGQENSHNNIID